jgi:hypothetical protein
MRTEFISRIKNHTEPLFDNMEGSKQAYQLCIRHLSAATPSGLSTFSKGYVILNDILYIVNLEDELIEPISDPIKLIALKSLP